MKIDSIDVICVQNFYYHLLDSGLSSKTAKNVIIPLRKCLDYAKKLNIINKVPCDIEYTKSVNSKKVRIWTEDELLYFISQIHSTTLYLPVLLASFTGARVAEVCGLRWCNVDLKNSRIKICEQVIHDKLNKKLVLTDVLKTPNSYRTITIPSFLTDILKESKPDNYIEKINDFVILNRRSSMYNPNLLSKNFSYKVSKYLSKPDKSKCDSSKYKQLPEISIHDLRHTHATILLKHGENIKVISERLGHNSIQTTLDTYSHVLESMEEHTATLLDNIFKNKI